MHCCWFFKGWTRLVKDEAIRHVLSRINPEGCEAYRFKQPSAEELEHDFLWRAMCRLPERGRIGIFNRSYYEEVLVDRVHPETLRNEGLSEEFRDEKAVWEERYQSIENFEIRSSRDRKTKARSRTHHRKRYSRGRSRRRENDHDHAESRWGWQCHWGR